jgi:dipeptide transport system substrate-binding protein
MGNLLFIFLTLIIFANPAFAAKTLVYCAENNPSNFSPPHLNDMVVEQNTIQMFNNLVKLEIGTTEIIPDLAESWQISKDGLTYTFHLRKDVSFHKTAFFTPTRKMNADDVVFTMDRMLSKKHPYHDVGGSVYMLSDSLGLDKLIKETRKIDDYTIQFILHRPEAPFLADLAITSLGITSKEYGDQLLAKGTPQQIDFQPIGTGAFMFVRHDKDQNVRYKANPDYFRGKPAIDNLIFSITPEASVRYQKMKSGECQFNSQPAISDLPRMKKDPNLTVIEQPGLNVGYLALNTLKKPLNNVDVRKAIYHALNRESYVKALYEGEAVLNGNPLPQGIWSYNKKIIDYPHNTEIAKQLLTKAGFPDGFKIQLWTLPVTRAYNPNGKRMGEMMQSDLAKVGIKAELKSYDWAAYLEGVRRGDHEMAQFGWNAETSDPHNFLYGLLSCSAVKAQANQAEWCFQPYDKLVTKAKELTNQAERKKLYEQAQVIFHEQVPWVPLVTAVNVRVMSKNVTGYKMSALNLDYFETVDLR